MNRRGRWLARLPSLLFRARLGPGHEATANGKVPYQEMRPKDENGRWNFDVVRIQDYMAYTAQGEIVDRTQEHLGASDQGVILFRQMLLEQLDLVAGGEDPMNVFRDPAANTSIKVPVISTRYKFDPRGRPSPAGAS